MKKIIGIVACAALVATSAFADVNVGAWGRSGVNMISASSATQTSKVEGGSSNTTTYNYDPLVVKTPDGNWAGGSRVGVKFGAASEDGNIGFTLNVDSNGASAAIGDQAKIWAKLFNQMLEVQFGKIQLDDLRGSVGDWGNRDVQFKAEDDIFPRFNPQNGMTVAFRPVDGMFIGGMIDINTAKDDYSDPAKNVYKSAAGGFGYTIKDVAQLKAAYWGSSTDDHYGKLCVGADLLMIANNTIEIGVTLPFAKDHADGYANICVGVKGGADKLSYKGHVFADFNKAVGDLNLTISDSNDSGDDKDLVIDFTAENSANMFGFDAGVEYDLGVFTLGGTAAYGIAFAKGTASIAVNGATAVTENFDNYVLNEIRGEVYAKKGFSNGYIFAGVKDVVSIASTSESVTINNLKTSGTANIVQNTFSIPVGLEYAF